MQTFLPYADFDRSASVLDTRRLGKQIIEARQIAQAIIDPTYGWQHHPAVEMWRGPDIDGLRRYAAAMNREWERRRDRDHGAFCNFEKWLQSKGLATVLTAPNPWWVGFEPFHASHRSNLLRKDPEHYSQFGWTESPDLPYVWPTFRMQDWPTRHIQHR